MNETKIDQVLAELRAVANQSGLNATTATKDAASSSFSDLLKESVEQVNRSQNKASALAQSLERDEGNVDISAVMIEMQKARVAFETAVQVRNRLISAYKDIMNMPI